MATQIMAAPTGEHYLENQGCVKAAQTIERLKEKEAGFFDRVGDIL
jgi:hypothetical protein